MYANGIFGDEKIGGNRMANQEHLDIIKQGVKAWNQWRREHPEVQPDLSGTDLSDANLREANLSGTNIIKADLWRANLSGAILYRAATTEADLSEANLSGANLSEAYLDGVDFREANLSRADLTKADLSRATLVKTNCSEAILTNCRVYGISAWNVQLDRAKQENLVITDDDEPTITVDNLKIAQFIYLLLNNAEIRDAIDTIAKKAVLILGRFTSERKVVLDSLREELRTHGFLPMLFDFEKPASRDITETISTLAHLARFVIADITDARSIPQELMAIVPTLPSLAVQPLLLASQHEYGMFEYFMRFPWVLPVYLYQDQTCLLASLNEHVITPAEQKAQELEKR
jgi:uncharacterized protein YjbI with pentapeptide repeats